MDKCCGIWPPGPIEKKPHPCNRDGKFRVDGKQYCEYHNPHQCVETFLDSGGYHRTRCCCNGKVQRDGKWYCGKHDPVAVKEKQEKKQREWNEKYEAEKKARDAAWAAKQERDRRAEHYPVLVATIEAISNLLNPGATPEQVARAKEIAVTFLAEALKPNRGNT